MKITKFFGIALLVAGVSFAVASCDKDSRLAVEEPIVEESMETVDFSDLTKGDFDESLYEVAKDIHDAIVAITRGITTAKEDAIGALYDGLFDLFTFYNDGLYTYNPRFFDIFKATLQYSVVHQSEYNAVTVTFSEGKYTFKTDEGYYLNVNLPSWYAQYWRSNNSQGHTSFNFVPGCQYKVEIGKNDKLFASADFEIDDDSFFDSTADVKIYEETQGAAVAGVNYCFNPYTGLVKTSSVIPWYNNMAVAGYDGTFMKATNLDKVFWALSQMTDTYSYTSSEAKAIAGVFNTNVFAASTFDYNEYSWSRLEGSTRPAVIKGLPLHAAVFQDATYSMRDPRQNIGTNLFRVALVYGVYAEGMYYPYNPSHPDGWRVVNHNSAMSFLRDYFDKVIDQQTGSQD